MPLFQAPAGENDGGYAVSSYRDGQPAPRHDGRVVASWPRDLRGEGISLTVDFVFNHTSDEHEWARRAQAGEAEYQEFYWIFPDRTMPDAYERNLREIFPDARAGQLHLSPRHGPVGLDHLLQLPVGPELLQPGRIPGDA